MKQLATLLVFSLLFVACEDDDDPILDGTADLEVNFAAEFGDRALAIQSATYDYPGGDALKMQLFQYYVSDLALIPTDGSAPVLLSEIELVRYQSATEDNVETRSFSVPSGQYSGVSFGFGVKPELNALDPNNFAANDPLNENEFWNDRARYVFAKIEANADLNEDALFDTNVTLHMGADALYRVVTLDKDITIRPNQDASVTIANDILEAMAGAGSAYDITVEANRRVHGGNQAIATDLYDRLGGQFSIQ